MASSIRILLVSMLVYSSSAGVWGQQKTFESYREVIPGTDLTVRMVPIPKGTFQMGSPTHEPGHQADEGPVHQVHISPFWMAEAEITWDVYQLFIDREIDGEQPDPVAGPEVDLEVDAVTGATQPYIDMSLGMGRDGFPAVSMTQLAASRFCQWLSALTGHFYRLPTEAEWEYACRAGSVSRYGSGTDSDQLDTYGWYQDNSGGKYQQVKTKEPNAWGLYDMHGNVAEWTLDQYQADGYTQHEATDPLVLPNTTYPRVVRGGSWMDASDSLRCASRRPSTKIWKRRDPQIPKSKWWHTDAPFLGFRMVRPYKSPLPAQQNLYWGEQ